MMWIEKLLFLSGVVCVVILVGKDSQVSGISKMDYFGTLAYKSIRETSIGF